MTEVSFVRGVGVDGTRPHADARHAGTTRAHAVACARSCGQRGRVAGATAEQACPATPLPAATPIAAPRCPTRGADTHAVTDHATQAAAAWSRRFERDTDHSGR